MFIPLRIKSSGLYISHLLLLSTMRACSHPEQKAREHARLHLEKKAREHSPQLLVVKQLLGTELFTPIYVMKPDIPHIKQNNQEINIFNGVVTS